MFVVDEITGDIKLHQGDTGEYTITDLIGYEEGARVFFAVQDSKRRFIGSQIESIIDNDSTVFKFNQTLTNLLTVKPNEETAEYYGGIKVCTSEGDEETIKVGNKQDGEMIVITVYPKEAEGI